MDKLREKVNESLRALAAALEAVCRLDNEEIFVEILQGSRIDIESGLKGE